jgi:hypothetical protein
MSWVVAALVHKSASGTSGGGGEQLLLARVVIVPKVIVAVCCINALRFPVQSQVSESTWLRGLAQD